MCLPVVGGVLPAWRYGLCPRPVDQLVFDSRPVKTSCSRPVDQLVADSPSVKTSLVTLSVNKVSVTK